MARDPIDPPSPDDHDGDRLEAALKHDLNPLFTNPPDPGPIPETLRRPVHAPKDPDTSPALQSIAGAGAGWGMATDFLVTILAGLGLGWVVDHFADSAPWGLVAGLGLGFVVAFIRIVRQTQRAERAEAAGRHRTPR